MINTMNDTRRSSKKNETRESIVWMDKTHAFRHKTAASWHLGAERTQKCITTSMCFDQLVLAHFADLKHKVRNAFFGKSNQGLVRKYNGRSACIDS
jgi:hypothetical protein